MGESGGDAGCRVTVTLPALALGRFGAALGIDRVSFLDLANGHDDGTDLTSRLLPRLAAAERMLWMWSRSSM